jgi:hypothetical protein
MSMDIGPLGRRLDASTRQPGRHDPALSVQLCARFSFFSTHFGAGGSFGGGGGCYLGAVAVGF